jgi:hypothetical protein
VTEPNGIKPSEDKEDVVGVAGRSGANNGVTESGGIPVPEAYGAAK